MKFETDIRMRFDGAFNRRKKTIRFRKREKSLKGLYPRPFSSQNRLRHNVNSFKNLSKVYAEVKLIFPSSQTAGRHSQYEIILRNRCSQAIADMGLLFSRVYQLETEQSFRCVGRFEALFRYDPYVTSAGHIQRRGVSEDDRRVRFPLVQQQTKIPYKKQFILVAFAGLYRRTTYLRGVHEAHPRLSALHVHQLFGKIIETRLELNDRFYLFPKQCQLLRIQPHRAIAYDTEETILFFRAANIFCC